MLRFMSRVCCWRLGQSSDYESDNRTCCCCCCVCPGFAAGGFVDLEIMKLMTEDDIGKAPSAMIAALRCAASVRNPGIQHWRLPLVLYQTTTHTNCVMAFCWCYAAWFCPRFSHMFKDA
jgi:hypothetical protein